jgi:hypothetical protein
VADDIWQDGMKAEALLKDETLKKAFARLEQGYLAEWKTATTPEKRETMHARVIALGDILGTLGTMVGARDMAKAEDARFGRNPKR